MQIRWDNDEKRIGYIDVFRGIGIILMVLGHMELSDKLYTFIHAFHMPMFFYISGFCHHRSNKTFGEYCIYKAKGLLIPYFVFGIGEFILWRIVKGDSFNPLLHLFSINTEGIAIAGALWFLTALYIVEILYFLIEKAFDKSWVRCVIVVVLSILGMFLPQILQFRLPFGFDSALVGLGFFYLGVLLQNNEKNKFVNSCLNANWWQQLLMIFAGVLLISMNDSVNMRTAQYSNVFLFWINAILAIIVIINVSKDIEKYANKVIYRVIKTIGKDGIVYVCINQLIITILSEVISKLSITSHIFSSMILIAGTFICLWVCGRVILTTRMSLLVGKDVI